MGAKSSKSSIVQDWGSTNNQILHGGPKFDAIELRSNKKSELQAVGLVRTIEGEGFVSMSVQDTNIRTQIYYEEFKIDANYLSKSQIKNLKEKVILSPGVIYRIRVNYQGKSCYTYSDTKLFIKEKDYEVEMRRDITGTPEGNYRFANLITDLQIVEHSKGRGCCG